MNDNQFRLLLRELMLLRQALEKIATKDVIKKMER